MTQLNSKKRLDNSNGIGQDNPNETMNAKKSPWHLRFAPGAILRQIGLAVLALTMLFGVQSATAQITIDSTTEWRYVGAWYEVGVTVFGLGPDNDIYNYPQWTVTSIRQDDDPNSDIDLPGLRAKIASINATFVAELSSIMQTYMDAIDSATAAFVSNTQACFDENWSTNNCPRLAFRWGWWLQMATAISTLESGMASATQTANDAMEAWINYIN